MADSDPIPDPKPSAEIRDWFDRLVSLRPDERAQQLESLMAQDPRLAHAVADLLEADESGALTQDVEVQAAAALHDIHANRQQSLAGAPGQGDRVGPYVVLEQLGAGGFGVVYKAEQREPVRRTVALKLVKPGFDTKEILARFDSERQALARMDHPHIAKVLDAGATEAGRPYFVMEYVPGLPLTRFADEHKLTLEQRLALFRQVCDAIQHAHVKSILHRDIKASNVLAFLRNGEPIVKVIDFGIAKAMTTDRLTDLTFNTAGGAVIGTYATMSPEQAAGSPDIDTRSDVYSLGVLLYELLTGKAPFDPAELARTADDEVRRIIREVDPPAPSTRLTSLGAAETQALAKSRALQVDELRKKLRQELEWIPLKALRKERDRRYQSAEQMGQDLENYLQGLPLLAGPESRSYRLRKAMRRNRGPLAAGVAVAVVLVLGILGTSAGLSWALAEKNRADTAAESEAAQREIAQRERNAAQAQRIAAEQREYEARVALALTDIKDAIRATDDGKLHRARGLLGAVIRDPSIEQDWWWAAWHLLRRSREVERRDLAASFPPGVPTTSFMNGAAGAAIGPEASKVYFDGWRRVENWGRDQDGNRGGFVVDIEDGTAEFARFPFSLTRAPSSLRLPDGRLLRAVRASSAAGRGVTLLSADNGAELWRSELGVNTYDVRPQDGLLALGMTDGSVRFVDLMVDPPQEIDRLSGYSETVMSVRFSEDGTRLLGLVGDWTLVKWLLEPPDLAPLGIGTGLVGLDASGRWAGVRDDRRRAHLHDLQEGRVFSSGDLGREPDIAVAGGGGAVFTFGLQDRDASLQKWSVAGDSLAPSHVLDKQVRSCVISHDGSRAIATNKEGFFEIDLRTGSAGDRFGQLTSKVYAEALQWDEERDLLFAAFYTAGGLVGDDSVRGWQVWQVSSRQLVAAEAFAQAGGVRCLDVSPDGALLAIGGRGGTASIWDWKSEKRLVELPVSPGMANASTVCSVNFMSRPEGLVLVTVTAGGRVDFWQVESGRRLAGFMIPGVADQPNGFWYRRSFVPAGDRRLVLAPGDGEAISLDLDYYRDAILDLSASRPEAYTPTR